MKSAVLSIFYTQEGKLHHSPQGKYFEEGKNSYFLMDKTDKELMRMGQGYTISNQILEAFEKLKLRPQIVIRLKRQGTILTTTRTKIRAKGVPYGFGGHSQTVVPVKICDVKPARTLKEPTNLSVIDLNTWMKGSQTTLFGEDGSFSIV